MNNRKKVIGVINKFPAVSAQLKLKPRDETKDYILDTSGYLKPSALISAMDPDFLLLNLGLAGRAAIHLVALKMQGSGDIKIGMITSDPYAYYMSLCSTFYSNYFIGNPADLEEVPCRVSYQQLN